VGERGRQEGSNFFFSFSLMSKTVLGLEERIRALPRGSELGRRTGKRGRLVAVEDSDA
jgi:hypothetical protein